MLFLVQRDQKRNFATLTVAFAVSLPATATALAESLPATLALWPRTSPANDGAATQSERTTRAKIFFILPPLFVCCSWRTFINSAPSVQADSMRHSASFIVEKGKPNAKAGVLLIC